MATKYIKDYGFAKVLGLEPTVSPANPSYSKTVTVNGCKLKYSAKVDTGSNLNIDLTTGTGSWGIFDDLKDKLTSTEGITTSLAKNFGALGKAAQDYLTEKGFGEITMGAGSVSFDVETLELTLEGFKVSDENQFNYVPYAKKYTTTQTVSLSKTIDLSNTFKAAVAALIILSIFYLWEFMELLLLLNWLRR